MSERITVDWRDDRYGLDKIMEIDHVIQVHDDGTVSEPTGVWAPEVYSDDDGTDVTVDSMKGGPTWSLLSGFTSQYAYHGPVMDVGEYVGGHLARHILETPGYYAVVVVTDGYGSNVGWAVAFAEGE